MIPNDKLLAETEIKLVNHIYFASVWVSWTWSRDGKSFTCTCVRYSARANGQSGGNLRILVQTRGGSLGQWHEELLDNAIQDGQPHYVGRSKTIPSDGTPAKVHVGFKYDRDNVGDIDMTNEIWVNYVAPPVPLIINAISHTGERNFEISGRSAVPGALLLVYRDPDFLISNGSHHGNGLWSAKVSIPQGANSVRLTAKQAVGELYSDLSNAVTVALVDPVFITYPVAGGVITASRTTVSGTGHSGATINIFEAGNESVSYGSTPVMNNTFSVLTSELPEGKFTFQARQSYNGTIKQSNLVPVTIRLTPDLPVITSPEALSRQNTTFRIGGTGGVAGALMEILRDLDHSIKVGQATVTGDGWSVDVTDEPGRNGLVARMTVAPFPPVVSLQPRAFDIVPPAVTGVDVTNPSAGIVQFNGPGYEGATVVITITSGPGGAAPAEAKVVNGAWQTAATGWPNGKYLLKVIQKITNNSNGWIESKPYEFEFTNLFPTPYDVTSTAQYQPTISGSGLFGAKVSVLDSDKLTKIAPDAPVGSDNTWSTPAYRSWGPTWDRPIYVHQFLDSDKSESVEHIVRIPPIAPGINRVSPDSLSPTFTGTCELNAEVNLVFSGSTISYPAVVIGMTWSFQRPQPFTPDIGHTVTAIQVAAQQPSPPASQPFLLYRPMVPVVITEPAENSEKGHGDVTFEGTSGMKGATVTVWDYVNGRSLGSVTLSTDGPWKITVPMTFDRWVVRAKQVIDGRESADSDSRVFNVVLLQPEIDNPAEAGTLTRTSRIEGRGEPFGSVDVFLESSTTPFLKNVPIAGTGQWSAEATMPVGNISIKARQYFQNQTSKDTPPRTYKVVPHSPFVETPAAGDHVGRHAMVSGFGVPGDTVKVKLAPGTGPALGETLVGEDRAWSVRVEILRAGPAVSLVATSSEGAFESAASASRSVLAGTFEPTFTSPEEGLPVRNPVDFAGEGKDGEGRIWSWYNPDVIQASGLPVTNAAGWQGQASIALSTGGNWSVFQQALANDQDGATVSDKVTSHRFEVDPEPSDGKSADIPDERSS